MSHALSVDLQSAQHRPSLLPLWPRQEGDHLLGPGTAAARFTIIALQPAAAAGAAWGDLTAMRRRVKLAAARPCYRALLSTAGLHLSAALLLLMRAARAWLLPCSRPPLTPPLPGSS